MPVRGLLIMVALLFGLIGCSGSQGSGESSDGAARKEGTEETAKQALEESTSSGEQGAARETTGSLDEAARDGERESEPERNEESGMLISDTLVAGARDSTGGPLVDRRLVTYYGHPFSEEMGILGQSEPEAMISDLKAQTREYTKADPERPAMCGVELIASVAQPEPGPDGLYLTRTPPEEIERYSRAARENDCLLLLDVQIGYSTIEDEIEALMPFLKRDHVHLAIDPEYDMDPGEVPGQQFGTSTGEELMGAARTLSDLVEREGLPPKILVIHQFRYDMISNKNAIEPVENVEIVLHADGFGAPEDKFEKYDLLVRDEPIQYGGFKLFYTQDTPLLTPEQVLERLRPKPAVISYQ